MNKISADRIFSIDNPAAFEELALEVFRYQSLHNPVYKQYLELMHIPPERISSTEEIPFLPVEFFRTRKILTGKRAYEFVFESSGTSGDERSRHYIADASLYRRSFTGAFRHFYGSPGDYCILALLPSYLDRKNSSLAYMAGHLIRLSEHPESGFYLNDYRGLVSQLEKLEEKSRKVLLLGVSFALLELAERYPLPLRHTLVMETGGMKGHRKELTRKELHEILGNAFHLKDIHSEYGMTELLTQAYAKREGIFHTPPWMKVLIRDPNDPLSVNYGGRSGGINIIDLANVHSCSFIATQDVGTSSGEKGFSVLGRFDGSELRGCNLLLE